MKVYISAGIYITGFDFGNKMENKRVTTMICNEKWPSHRGLGKKMLRIQNHSLYLQCSYNILKLMLIVSTGNHRQVDE